MNGIEKEQEWVEGRSLEDSQLATFRRGSLGTLQCDVRMPSEGRPEHDLITPEDEGKQRKPIISTGLLPSRQSLDQSQRPVKGVSTVPHHVAPTSLALTTVPIS